MKPAEMKLNPPGISVMKGGMPSEAARQVREAFPNAAKLQEQARIVGSATEGEIRQAGFDILPDPTRKFPNHHRMIHPDGIAGFNDENLGRLSRAFTDSEPGE